MKPFTLGFYRLGPARSLVMLWLVSVILFALAAGCATIGPAGRDQATEQWVLLAPEQEICVPALVASPLVLSLKVNSASTLDGTAMAYSDRDHHWAFYRDNRWAVPPAQMIKQALKGAFNQQNWVAAVATGSTRLPADIEVVCNLTSLQHRVLDQASGRAELGMSCLWIESRSRLSLDRGVYFNVLSLEENTAAEFVRQSQQLLDAGIKAIVRQTSLVAGKREAAAPPVPAP